MRAERTYKASYRLLSKPIHIGIISTIDTGAAFYQKWEKLMAQIFPDESHRPITELSLTNEPCATDSNALIKRVDVCLNVTISDASKETKCDTSNTTTLDADSLFKLAFTRAGLPATALQIDSQGHDPFIDFSIAVAIPTKPASPDKRKKHTTHLGILAGMGPLAGADFLMKLVQLLPRVGIKISCLSNAWYPHSRKQAFKGLFRPYGPMAWRREIEAFCKRRDIDRFCAPCNTFHKHINTVQDYSTLRFTNLIDEVCRHCAAHYSGKRIGLLATTRTVNTKLYDPEFFKLYKITLIIPPTRIQRLVQAGINAEKSGFTRRAKQYFLQAAKHMHDIEGVEALILGCTEIPIELTYRNTGIPCIDTAAVLAESMAEYVKVDQTSDTLTEMMEPFLAKLGW
ncbi:MAG: aspartate/glutamate racemase family protein [Coxiellaceae bacterium]|nr:aspartate/glutamate racemase family protein [Coxiellaceae bacterium]